MGYGRGDDVLNRVMRLFKRPVRFPRDGVVLMLTGFVTENGLTARIVERLGGDTLNAVGTPNEIEARLLDLWIVNEALTRTDVHLPTERIQSLVDSFHWESYRNFLSRGMTSDELKQLQSRLRDRYAEYGQALPPVLQAGHNRRWPSRGSSPEICSPQGYPISLSRSRSVVPRLPLYSPWWMP